MATRWFIVLAAFLAGSDQLTKWLARTQLDVGVRHEIIDDFFRITLNYNEGIAWGMLPDYKEYLTIFAMVMVVVILIFMRKLEKDEVWLKISLSFMMAGAVGNMTDRLIYQKVTDFLDVRLFNPWSDWYYNWPIFNLADSYIVIGATILFFVVFLSAGDTIRTSQTPTPAGVTGSLGPLGDGSSGWEDNGPRIPGTVPEEEALIELPKEPDTDSLRPIEEADKIRQETISGSPEKSPDESSMDDRFEQDPPPEDGSIEELTRRPDPEN